MSQAAILGAACRLPGAPDAEAFWRLLTEGRCAVGALPAGRWDAARYFHPRAAEPGFSYSFDGGYIDTPLAFDPAVFGISPREAAEMDPQQRLLLEVVWSALEDCGIPPSSVAGRNVGVFVGASSLDYGNLHTTDPAAIESHFMTGNTLSILSNRISYVFDLRGPSFTIDTACSSSLVAFAEAQAAITSGRIDMAVVAGVNLLMSPTSFIGFSRASMLSPTGRCRPFSAAGDGYVRAEGAVAMVLCRLETALARHYPVRAVAMASGINSDGRTNGIALPSADGQRALLDRLYGDGGIDPRALAFVEAHGTGTRVGDPAEAAAIGGALARGRDTPLPIGSVKSNIGHLEPASGLAGVLKAMLALEHRLLPASLHAEQLNPAIDFAELNLVVAREAVPLPNAGTWLAGISSFGFGGTNAHAVIRQAEAAEQPVARQNGAAGRPPEILVLSAHSKQALGDTAAAYVRAFEAGADVARTASGVAWQRDLAGHRLALPLSGGGEIAALRTFAETGRTPAGLSGIAPSSPPKICFVYSGNGCQWAGMGRAAFAGSAAFRRRFEAVDALFGRLAEWSLTAALHDDGLGELLTQTRIAQPLLFAVQSSLTAGLAEWGLRPAMALGHSVGEVAAAEASGALSLVEAVRVIFHRSEHQESARGLGGMAVASLSADACKALLEDAGLNGSGLASLEIAAVNSPGSVTISGSDEAISVFSRLARKRRTAVVRLGLAYPFHSRLLESLRRPLLASLGEVQAGPGDIPFLSTVTAGRLSGEALDGEYWWRNVREPVRFQGAIEAAARLGATLFIEIGPRPILTSNIADTLAEAGLDGAALPSLTERDAADPLAIIAASAVVQGCTLNRERLFGARPAGRVALPPTAWQRKSFAQPQTSEALDIYGTATRHPLIGARLAQGTPEWRTLLDATIVPYLADHRIDGEIVVPGTAFAEMALAVARQIHPAGPIGLEDFDLLQWMTLRPDAMREISVRLSGDTHIVEIWSRPRLAADEWSLHARGRITALASPAPAFVPKEMLPHHMTAERVYACAANAGVEYGPAFRRLVHADRSDTIIEIALSPIDVAMHGEVLHPIALDAAFHAMFENIKPRLGERYAYLPVRFANLRVDRDGAIPARARVVVDRETDQSVSVSISLFDANERFIAGVTGGLLRAVVLHRRRQERVFFTQQQVRLSRHDRDDELRAAAAGVLRRSVSDALPESWLLLGAFACSLAFRSLRSIFGNVAISPASLRDGSLVAGASAPFIMALLEHLAAAGLAVESAEGWVLAQDSGLPEPAEILLTLAAGDAGATAEIVLAAQALNGLEHALRTGEPIQIRAATSELLESSALLFAPALSACRAVCDALCARIAPEPLRVVVAEPSCLGLLRILAPLTQQGQALVTVVGTDARRLRQAEARYGASEGVVFAAVDAASSAPLAPRAASGSPSSVPFDAAFAFAFGPAFDGDVALARAMGERLQPHGLLCLVQPPETLLLDVLLGTSAGWFSDTLDPQFPLGRMAAAQDASGLIAAAGFTRLQSHTLGRGHGSILLASPEATGVVPARNAAPVLLLHTGSVLLDRLAKDLENAGRRAQMVNVSWHAQGMRTTLERSWTFVTSELAAGAMADLVFPALDVAGDLGAVIADLAAVLDVVQQGRCRLWVVVQGLQSGSTPDGIDPVAEAIWCFARVAMNEYPAVEMRLVDLAPDLDAAVAAQALAGAIASPSAEAELLIDATGLSAVRLAPWAPATSRPVPAARLSLRGPGVQASFDWRETARREPGPGEVEIEIAASGLNFRDIMLATGLLDDDVLDDGLAGAVFGFECAGRVVRAGSAVTTLAVGDAVMGFGRESFATHSTADARVFTRVPASVSLEAAATIPVAFLTAWYALVHMARIEPGEWVLIHGAAGGVGLAAIQIARLRGARVAATVSSPDKHALAKLFGAEKIYNSRNTAFLDAIRADIGGVDVVLNSLAGEAMQASIKCLKPFGRFVELGKRDYVANTALGLRPFRRNLTYYGVDLDQLLAARLPLANALMADLARHFEDESLLPLPYRAFEWFEADRAFQSMQAAAHVGKLLVRPAARPMATVASDAPFRAGKGVHLVVGGAGGFGFEAAAWLASCGAETIVVASRRGAIEAHLQARAKAIRAADTALLVETLDVTDADAVSALVERLSATHGRLAGVLHAAMVLDDGLIATLDPVRTRAVLAPKVAGAANLDRATKGLALDYFVAFSSATTMIGNPGQGAYVAANGYLQGLMRRRRSDGLPALAVGWGAIADAGVLARDRTVADRLERISGIAAMQAKDALAYLGTLLARGDGCPPMVHCALIRPGSALQGLTLLRTPAFSTLFDAPEDGGQDHGVDVASQIAGKSEGDARALVARIVALEVARIFRLSQEDIDLARPLDELGLDSMMSLDLRMGIEKRFGIDMPVVGISAGVSVNDLASRLLAVLRAEAAGKAPDDPGMAMIEQHGSADIDAAGLKILTAAVRERDSAAALL